MGLFDFLKGLDINDGVASWKIFYELKGMSDMFAHSFCLF